MKILINSHGCRFGGGISVAKNIISAFVAVASENKYLITVPEGLGFSDGISENKNVNIVTFRYINIIQRYLWDAFFLKKLIKDYRPDVVLNLANMGFCEKGFKQVTLLQDSHLFYPSSHYGDISLLLLAKFNYQKWRFRRSLPYTDLVLCQTNVARRRLTSLYGDSLRIDILPNRITKSDTVQSDVIEPPLEIQKIKKYFKLFVLSRYYPHKNLEVLISLFKKYRNELRDVRVLITISEEESKGASNFLWLIKKENLGDLIINVGPIPQSELSRYFKNSDALFLPTLLESYSGTYVEALEYGLPILTSDFDFAQEVCGKAAVYFNCLDLDDILSKILLVKNDSTMRERLIKEGKKIKREVEDSWSTNIKELNCKLNSL